MQNPARLQWGTLRLSVTDRCNLRCVYCVPERGAPRGLSRDLPSLDELARAACWLVRELGLRQVKVSGGEPLLSGGLEKIIRDVSKVPGLEDLSMTTNGTLLAPRAEALRKAGLCRVNVSLDTLDAARFAALTRGGRLQDALDGIDAAVDGGLRPVKLNAVLRRSSWRQDVPALLDYASIKGLEIRFIELMRTGTEAAWAFDELVPATEVSGWLEQGYRSQPLAGVASSPARRTRMLWRSGPAVVGWITPRTSPFCHTCDRIRLDARGRVRRCLMDEKSFPLIQRLRTEDSVAVLGGLFDYLAEKQLPDRMASELPMSAIGG